MSSSATGALGSLEKPSGTRSDDLARAAVGALPKVARAAGHPIAASASDAPGGGSRILLIVLALAAAACSGALAVLTVRRRGADG
jgi:hypothetical protein